MKTFNINVIELIKQEVLYTVEANTEEEALELFKKGEAFCVEAYPLDCLDVGEPTITEDE